jgi:hypothetical protein
MEDKILTIILFFIFFATIPVARAGTEIYKHVDSDGRVTFSNKPIKGANRLQPIHSSPKFNPGATQNSPPYEVSNHTQKKRDTKRRQLLENELKNELRLLVDAKLILAKTIKDSEIIKINTTPPQNDAIKHENTVHAIQKRVLLHERNVTALKKELSSF